jgi:hypothetical protein
MAYKRSWYRPGSLALLLALTGPRWAFAAAPIEGLAAPEATAATSVRAVLPQGVSIAPMSAFVGSLQAAPAAAPTAIAAPLAAPAPSAAAAPALAPSAPTAASDEGSRSPSALGSASQAAARPAAPGAPSGQVFDGSSGGGRGSDDELVPFRSRIREAGLYLLHRDARTGDDSLGRRLSPSYEAGAVGDALSRHGAEALRGQSLYVTGVAMGSEKAVRERVAAALSGLGLGERDARVQVLSIPRSWDAGAWRALRDRVVYFFPSRTRDFQHPLRDEMIAGAVTTAILEAPNAAYLLTQLPSPDGAIVLGIHAAVLAPYTILQRSMGNWIMRSKGAESFAKNGLASMPFILNYNVFGHFSAITAFAASAGVSGVLSAVPAQALQFGVTQGLTTALQTAFYSYVVMQGFRGWAASQKTPENAVAARSWVSALLLPWLWIDSVLLTQASTASTVLAKWGPFTLTGGHVALAALLLAGKALVSRPKLLDATLPWYRRLRAALSRLRS